MKRPRASRMDGILQACRSSLRLLVRDRLFSLTTIVSLALGIGSTGAAFACYEVLFLRALPGVEGAGRVVALYTQMRGSSMFLPISYPNYRDLRDQSTSFSRLAAAQAIRVALADRGAAEQVRGEMVSASYFDVLGVRPARGRLFLPQEDRVPGRYPVVVLSEGLWQRRFGGDPGIAGRSLRLDGRPYTVVGVAGHGFRGADVLAPAELWVPTMMYRQVSATADIFERRGDQILQVLGRLRPGVSAASAAAEAGSLGTRLAAAYPADDRDQRIVSLPLTVARLHPNGRSVLLRGSAFLLGMGCLLLLVTCSNVAILTLVRTLGRLDELALRSSLGASPGRLSWQIFAEGLPLALLALPLGALATQLEAGFLWRFRPPFLPADLLSRPLDGRVLGLLALVAAASAALLCLAPALQVRRLDPARTIHHRTQLHAGSDGRFSLRRGLVVAEIALAFVAISCAAYSVVRLRDLRRVDPGFDASRLLTVAFELRGIDLGPAAAKGLEDRLRERVTALPGVRSVAFAENRLLGGAQVMHGVAIAGRDAGPALVGSSLVEPAYFAAVGIPVLAGRTFDARPRAGGPPAAIVNATLAKRLWPGRSAVGEHLLLDDEKVPVEVVGVVGDSKLAGLDEAPRPFLYLPMLDRQSARLALQVRVAGDPRALLQTVVREVRAVAPGLPVDAETVETALDRALWWPQAMAGLLAFLSVLTLFVAGTGIYGITAHAGNRRRAEIGLRLALGARRRSIVRLVVREGFQILAAGTILGGCIAFALARWAAGPAGSPLPLLATLAGSELLLLVVTLLAELAPAWRAVKTGPATVLKES